MRVPDEMTRVTCAELDRTILACLIESAISWHEGPEAYAELATRILRKAQPELLRRFRECYRAGLRRGSEE